MKMKINTRTLIKFPPERDLNLSQDHRLSFLFLKEGQRKYRVGKDNDSLSDNDCARSGSVRKSGCQIDLL